MSSINHLLQDAISRHAARGLVAIIEPGRSISYAELGNLIDAYAAGFHAWGISRGTKVGIVAPKTTDAVAAYFGAMQAGACCCFIEPQLAPEALVDQMDCVGMHHLVVGEGLGDYSALPILSTKSVRELGTLRGNGRFSDESLSLDDDAMLLFTSGSTGKPKGVLLRHGSLACNAVGVLKHTCIDERDRLLHVMPHFHTNGVNNQLIVPFLAGATVILIERFRAEEAVAQLRDYEITYMTGVPTMYARMLPFVDEAQHFPRLRFLRCGSAPITPTLHQQIEAAFGVPLVVSYGLSEATCTTTMNPPERHKIGTIGTVLEGQQLRLFQPMTNVEVASGAEGEIRISGPTLMAGYIGADVEQPIVDGWLRTGDLGRFDEDGYVSITGRIKDVIIRGGENISPALIEKQLAAHPAIRECCVIGAPHADLGEVPVAFVVLHLDASLNEAELKDFVKKSLARIYVPSEFLQLEKLPTNGVGKVDRKALRGFLPSI